MARVNVGCGATPTPGWINIDNSISVRLAALPWLWPLLPENQRIFAKAARDAKIRAGVATRLQLPDASADVVYSSHMMEHLDGPEAEAFLAEARRVLAPGGVIRLVLPNIRAMAEAYVEHGDADRFVAQTRMGTTRARGVRDWLKHVVYGPRHHLWMYDGPSACRLLAKAGFAAVRELRIGETSIPDPGPLDLHERDAISIYVEGVKPAA